MLLSILLGLKMSSFGISFHNIKLRRTFAPKWKKLTCSSISRGVHFGGRSSLGLKKIGLSCANESSEIVLESPSRPATIMNIISSNFYDKSSAHSHLMSAVTASWVQVMERTGRQNGHKSVLVEQ